MKKIIPSLIFSCAMLASCSDPYAPTPRPDYVIQVKPTKTGLVAVPPPCANWQTDIADPFDNQPMPQFGCAHARNLALMIENPSDLIKGRELGPSNGVTATGSMLRYTHDQTRGLIWTGDDPNKIGTTTSSAAASGISGEIGGGSAASSSAASPASAP